MLHPVEANSVRDLGARFGIAGELLAFLWSQKLWWMIPLVVMLLLIAALVAFARSRNREANRESTCVSTRFTLSEPTSRERGYYTHIREGWR